MKDRVEFHRNSCRSDGLTDRCKACVSAHRKENPEKYRKYKHDTHVRSIYGIEPHEYAAKLAAAEGRCEVCAADTPGGKKRNFCVDHNHRTGAVRGLLCNRCNRALGLLGDDTEVLRSAIAYLGRYAA